MTMTIRRRRAVQAFGAAGAALAVPTIARAQEPLDSLKIIVGFPAGGSADVVSRQIADKLAPNYARSAIVDNRPGAAGRIAIDALKTSSPDGRTLLLTPASTVTVYTDIYRNLSYNPTTDLAPVSLAATFVHGLAVGPMVPTEVKTLAQFGAWCKGNPDKASCGNPGEGSFPHFLTLVMAKALGAPVQAVPYRGGAPALNDMIAGQLAALMLPDGSFLPYAQHNKIRVIATSGAARSPFYPNVPTFAEQGVKEIVVTEWFGLFAPAASPPAVVARASDAIGKVLATTAMAEAFAKFGMVPKSSSPAELAALIKTEAAIWGPIIRATGFKPLE
ncbi:MAG: Bug family tripartite tricarboxylate transporter substrate binding protein [Reyranella sp.]|nr:Bug family tripartite tricarboxylate transporter substrate binding protein [Reyranella sp.]